MAERTQNLQDLFLNSVRKNKNPLTIFLINGVKLTGVVTSFDNFCVLLRRDGHSQLVYKHAISTIMPSQPVQMFDGEDNVFRLMGFFLIFLPLGKAYAVGYIRALIQTVYG